MASITHNSLTLNLPDGWEDATMVTLLAPQPARTVPMHAGGAQTERPNVVIRREHLPGSAVTVAEFSQAQFHVLQQVMDDVTELATGELTVANDLPALSRDVSFSTPDGLMRQSQVFFRAGDDFYFAVLTASMDMDFDSVRDDFLAILEGVRP